MTQSFRRETVLYRLPGGIRTRYLGPGGKFDTAAKIEQDSDPSRIELQGIRLQRPMYRRRYRRRNFKNTYRRRRRALSGGRNAGRIALRKVMQMQRNTEKKDLSSSAATMQIPIGGAAIIEGFGPYMTTGTVNGSRIGNKVTIVSLCLRVNVKLTVIEALGCTVRLILVYDRHPRGANAGATDMLTSDDTLSGYNIDMDNRGRFQFLFDRTIQFGTDQGDWNDMWFKKMNKQVIYDGNAGDVTDVEKGNFLFMALGRNNAAAINVDYGYVFRYTDD